ncbi:helicase-related protein, partial [Shewanella sp. 0m-11]
QEIREQILADFKSGKIGLLIATGIAARGLDIDELPLVINYDLPYPADDYIHRIGRTGRAGASGQAVALVSKDDFKNLCMIESRLGHLIERREIEGFAPRKEVPISILNFKPKSKQLAVGDKAPRKEANSKDVSSKGARSKDARHSDTKPNHNDKADQNKTNKLPPNPWNL